MSGHSHMHIYFPQNCHARQINLNKLFYFVVYYNIGWEQAFSKEILLMEHDQFGQCQAYMELYMTLANNIR